MPTRATLLQSALTIVIAVTLSLWLQPRPDSATPPVSASLPPPAAEDEVQAVDSQDPDFGKQVFVELVKAQQARQRIQQRIEQLQNSVAQLQREAEHFDGNTSENTAGSRRADLSPSATDPNSAAILAQMGVSSELAQSIKQDIEQQELKRLFLRNQAIREGWMGTERYFNEAQQLTSQSEIYQQKLGPEAYDRYLYLAGDNNRVVIQHVMAGSPAEKAGIQVGDRVLSYGNTRIFNWSDLTDATTEGTQGESVSVQLGRGNSTLTVFIPRGPMGVRLDATRVEP